MNYKGDERYKPIPFVADDLFYKQKCTKNNCEAHEKTAMLLKEFDNVIYQHRVLLFDAGLNGLLEASPYSKDDIEILISNSFGLFSLGIRFAVIKRLIFTEKFVLDSSNECINKTLRLLYEENDADSIRKNYTFLFRQMVSSIRYGNKKHPYFDKVKYGCFKDILMILKEKDPMVRLKKLYSKKKLTLETLEIVSPEAVKFIEKMYDKKKKDGMMINV